MLLTFSGWSYTRVAFGYAFRAKLTHVELAPKVDPVGQSAPCAKLIVAGVMVTVGSIVNE